MSAGQTVRFVAADPGGLWRENDLATDKGWECGLPEDDPDFTPVRLLETESGETLALTDPWGRGLIEAAV